MKKSIILLCIALSISIQVKAEQPPFHIRTIIQTTENEMLKDEELANQVKSYINRDLRSLNDVILTNEDYFITIRTTVFEPICERVQKSGLVIMGGVMTYRLDTGGEGYLMHFMWYTPKNRLRETCDKIIVSLDNYLDGFRNMRE